MGLFTCRPSPRHSEIDRRLCAVTQTIYRATRQPWGKRAYSDDAGWTMGEATGREVRKAPRLDIKRTGSETVWRVVISGAGVAGSLSPQTSHRARRHPPLCVPSSQSQRLPLGLMTNVFP
jgi:hypothetical protein